MALKSAKPSTIIVFLTHWLQPAPSQMLLPWYKWESKQVLSEVTSLILFLPPILQHLPGGPVPELQLPIRDSTAHPPSPVPRSALVYLFSSPHPCPHLHFADLTTQALASRHWKAPQAAKFAAPQASQKPGAWNLMTTAIVQGIR